MKFEVISAKKQQIVQELIYCALDSNMRSKHGACLVKGNKVICMQRNIYGKDFKSCSFHAEVMINKRINKKLKIKDRQSYDLWVIRYSKNKNSTIESKPCYNCIKYMKKKMPYVNNIIYSTDNGKFIKEHISNIQNSHISLGNRATNLIRSN
jgi:tRNA(Arg) A34 adenosine deaminase TadA